jgi:hypothetical protein
MPKLQMSKKNRLKKLKTFSYRHKELAGEMAMLSSDIQNFKKSNNEYWVRSIAGRLHKLLVERPQNTPLLINLANEKEYALIVYISNIVIADIKAEKEGRITPIASVIPNILSTLYDPWYATPMPLEQAIELPCLILGGQRFTFRDILMDIRDTESHHSDLERPETLYTLDKLDIFGYSSAYMATYHLAQIVREIGGKFISSIK